MAHEAEADRGNHGASTHLAPACRAAVKPTAGEFQSECGHPDISAAMGDLLRRFFGRMPPAFGLPSSSRGKYQHAKGGDLRTHPEFRRTASSIG